MKSSVNHKELQKMNLIFIGTSGVGKSTLINEIFGEQLAKEGMGTRTTVESKKYESKILYCTTSNRFFKDELEVILKLREKYDGKKLLIVIELQKMMKLRV